MKEIFFPTLPTLLLLFQNGLNALHLAAKEGHMDLVQELLDRGAPVDSATKVFSASCYVILTSRGNINLKCLVVWSLEQQWKVIWSSKHGRCCERRLANDGSSYCKTKTSLCHQRCVAWWQNNKHYSGLDLQFGDLCKMCIVDVFITENNNCTSFLPRHFLQIFFRAFSAV